MTEAEQRLRRMTSIAWVGDPAELNAMWKETLLDAYQRGYADGNDDQITHSTAHQRGKDEAVERIRAALPVGFDCEYDGIVSTVIWRNDLDTILDAQADR